MPRIEPSQSDQQQQIDDLLELERQQEIQLQDTQAQNDLATRRADDARLNTQQSGDDRSAQAVSSASNQQSRGAEWVNFADRADNTVPASLEQIRDDERRVQESNNANAARDEANRREAQQRMTIQDIQNEAVKNSGIIRG